jgi:hypothetical protein
MRIPSIFFGPSIAVLILSTAGPGMTQDGVEGVDVRTSTTRTNETRQLAVQPGIWICWRDSNASSTTSRRFECSRGETAFVTEVSDYLNRTASRSGVTIWMETLAPEVLPILATMDNLESLTIVGSTFRAGSLRNLRRCSRLRSVCLDGCVVSDATCAELSEIRSLEYLQIAGSAVTDRGLRHLGRITGLKELDLRGTQISDSGLELLRNNQSLRLLDVRGTSVTLAGVKRLTGNLPNVRIHFRPVNRTVLNLVTR